LFKKKITQGPAYPKAHLTF